MSRRARVAAGAWILWRAFGAGASARAEDLPLPAVDVTVVGTAEDLEHVRGLVPRLAGGGARWMRVDRLDPADVLRERHDGAGPAVRAWIDLTVARRARLTFATRSGDRFLVRDFDLSGRLDEVDRAVLAEVLESSVDALVANERAGLTRAEAEAVLARREAPAPPPAPAPAARPAATTLSWAEGVPQWQPSRRAIGLFYGAQVLGSGAAIDHGFGVSLSYAAWRGYRAAHGTGRGPVVFASAQYRFPAHEETARIGVALDTLAARAGVECGPLGWSRLRVRLGAGADFIHVAPESSDPTVALAPKHWTAALAATAALRVGVWRGGRASWWSVVFFADVLPTAVRYDVAVGGATTPVFSPWHVRPGATLEAAFF